MVGQKIVLYSCFSKDLITLYSKNRDPGGPREAHHPRGAPRLPAADGTTTTTTTNNKNNKNIIIIIIINTTTNNNNKVGVPDDLPPPAKRPRLAAPEAPAPGREIGGAQPPASEASLFGSFGSLELIEGGAGLGVPTPDALRSPVPSSSGEVYLLIFSLSLYIYIYIYIYMYILYIYICIV